MQSCYSRSCLSNALGYQPVLAGLSSSSVFYPYLKLAEDGGLDWHKLSQAVKPETQCALIQRSCGYSWRKTLTVAEIQRAIELIKASLEPLFFLFSSFQLPWIMHKRNSNDCLL